MILKNNLYTKDYLLKNKITYYQYAKGYRTGIEPIIIASKVNKQVKRILDMGCGCGSISLMVAFRNKYSNIYGWDKNHDFLLLANKSKLENNLNNLIFEKIDNTKLNNNYINYFDIILTNPPFFLENSVIKSNKKLVQDAKYISKSQLEIWIRNMLYYLNFDGKAFLINRYANLKLLINIFSKYDINLTIEPIKSYVGVGPNNLIMEVNKSDKFSYKIIDDLIIHDKNNKSGYTNILEKWMS